MSLCERSRASSTLDLGRAGTVLVKEAAVLLALGLHQFELAVARNHDSRIGLEVDRPAAPAIGIEFQDQLDRLATRQMLVVGADDVPGGFRRVGLLKKPVLLLAWVPATISRV